MDHRAIIVDNEVNKKELIELIQQGQGAFQMTSKLRGAVFSHAVIEYWLEEEARHDLKPLVDKSNQPFRTFSSGEKKKALLQFVLSHQPHFLILDNPFDHLDSDSREALEAQLRDLSAEILIIQLVSRITDILPFVTQVADARKQTLSWRPASAVLSVNPSNSKKEIPIPPPPKQLPDPGPRIFKLVKVNVAYGEKPVLKDITWEVKPGEFWELSGPNGSGKTTILSMITGDNPKAFGQEIEIMGYRKGSGESVWDIKKHIGYFSPAITYRFRGNHSVINMLISGLYDSIGLYVKPSETAQLLAWNWLEVLDMRAKAKLNFRDLTEGEQRLVMCARAMIKHPHLLILDEPTSSLDDESARLVVNLVNKMATESTTAIIFVSHRQEPGLEAPRNFKLEMTPKGSLGIVID